MTPQMSRLCSLHFSKEQLKRDPDEVKENDYILAKTRTDLLPLHHVQDEIRPPFLYPIKIPRRQREPDIRRKFKLQIIVNLLFYV